MRRVDSGIVVGRKFFHDQDNTSYKNDLRRNELQMSTKIKWLKIKEKQGLLTLDQERQRDHEMKRVVGILPKEKGYNRT